MKCITLLAVLSMVSPASFARTADVPTAPGAWDTTATYTTTGAVSAETTAPGTVANGVRREPLTPEAGAYHADPAGRVLPTDDDMTTPTDPDRPGMVRDRTPGITPADPDVPVIHRTVPETDAAPGMNDGRTTPGAETGAFR